MLAWYWDFYSSLGPGWCSLEEGQIYNSSLKTTVSTQTHQLANVISRWGCLLKKKFNTSLHGRSLCFVNLEIYMFFENYQTPTDTCKPSGKGVIKSLSMKCETVHVERCRPYTVCFCNVGLLPTKLRKL